MKVKPVGLSGLSAMKLPNCKRLKKLDLSSESSSRSFQVRDKIKSTSSAALSLSFEDDEPGRGKSQASMKEALVAHSPGLPPIIRASSNDDVSDL